MSETVRKGGLGAAASSDILAVARSIEVELPEPDGEASPASPEPTTREPPADGEPAWQDATPHRMARLSLSPMRLHTSMRKSMSLDEAQFEGLVSPKAPKPKKTS